VYFYIFWRHLAELWLCDVNFGSWPICGPKHGYQQRDTACDFQEFKMLYNSCCPQLEDNIPVPPPYHDKNMMLPPSLPPPTK
jgi:hypothetical protein